MKIPINECRCSIDRCNIASCDKTATVDPDLEICKFLKVDPLFFAWSQTDHDRVTDVWCQVWAVDVHHEAILLPNHLI